MNVYKAPHKHVGDEGKPGQIINRPINHDLMDDMSEFAGARSGQRGVKPQVLVMDVETDGALDEIEARIREAPYFPCFDGTSPTGRYVVSKPEMQQFPMPGTDPGQRTFEKMVKFAMKRDVFIADLVRTQMTDPDAGWCQWPHREYP